MPWFMRKLHSTKVKRCLCILFTWLVIVCKKSTSEMECTLESALDATIKSLSGIPTRNATPAINLWSATSCVSANANESGKCHQLHCVYKLKQERRRAMISPRAEQVENKKQFALSQWQFSIIIITSGWDESKSKFTALHAVSSHLYEQQRVNRFFVFTPSIIK